MVTPKLIIHGGAGRAMKSPEQKNMIRQSLLDILDQTYKELKKGAKATDVVALGCALLEDCPHFNAGTGSVLQLDGQIRMSASLMDGKTRRFSGIINVSRIKNPIFLAQALQTSRDGVLSDGGASELARELGVPVYDPLVPRRLQEWVKERNQDVTSEIAEVVAEPSDTQAGSGTIGVVVLDAQGGLAAGTSTGGRGFERIGRVSDSAMPAGNYATESAAISCTGIGEDIINECLAARIVVRVEDGLSIVQAFERSFLEAQRHERMFGAIGIDHHGTIVWGKTSPCLIAAYTDGAKHGDTLELPSSMCVGED